MLDQFDPLNSGATRADAPTDGAASDRQGAVQQPALSGTISHAASSPLGADVSVQAGQAGAHQHLPDEYVTQLRQLGVRVTPQRLLVLEALAESGGHMTADALLQWAAQRYPALNLATVYRTLDLLVAHGLVAQTDLGSGVSYFELVGESPHHHIVCEHCGMVSNLDAELLAPLQEGLLDRYGFQANLRHVALFGTCRMCRAALQSGATATQLP